MYPDSFFVDDLPSLLYHQTGWGIIGVAKQAAQMKKYLLIVLILIHFVPSLDAQEKQRLAVIPFNPVNVPKDQAEVIYTDFEKALTETNAYVVIGRDDIIKLLGEGQQSLFSCTSDDYAIDIASQLAGRQVVRGRLVQSSEGYTLEIQILDVSEGRVLFKDTVAARFLSDMRDLMVLLAYKVAGLITIRNDNPTIAREFTQLFVETVPSRANIYINGIQKGISPDLIDHVPVGRIKVSAQYGNFYGERTLEVTQNTGEIRIECKEVYGSLAIRADENLDVYLDDRWLGNVASGPFNNLSVGIHTLELKGQGLYWREEVVLQSNRQTVVAAEPEEYGSIEYGFPQGAAAEITGEMLREVVAGYGVLPVPVGTYSAAVTGKNFEPYEELSITVSQNKPVTFQPVLVYTEEYEYELFDEQIREAERSIQYGYRPTSSDIQELRNLKQAITQSKHSFPTLLGRVEVLLERTGTISGIDSLSDGETERDIAEKERKLNRLLTEKQGLELEMESRSLARKRRATGGWIFLGISMTTTGLAGLSYYFANEAYREYQTAPPAEAADKEKLVKLWDTATIAALGTGGVSLLISSIFWISRPSIKRITQELDALNRAIQSLQDELR